MSSRVKTLVVAAAAVLMVAQWTAIPASAQPRADLTGVVATDEGYAVEVSDLPVLYQGQYYTDAEIVALNNASLAMFGDVRVTDAGEAVARAFDTYDELLAAEAATNEQVPDVAYPATESVQQRQSRLANSDQGAAQLDGQTSIIAAALSGCPNITYGSRDYDNANCGGSYLAVQPSDAIANFGTYGHNDKMSSIDIQYGGCRVVATLYNDASYATGGGVWRYYGVAGAYASYNLPSAQNDRVSSEKSTCA